MKTVLLLIGSTALLTFSAMPQEASTFKQVPLAETVEAGNFFGCSWADYDNDGWIDLFAVNAFGKPSMLYRNRGAEGLNTGQPPFIRITSGAIARDLADGGVGAWADYDNDGDLDLYTTNFESPIQDFFYRNDGSGNLIRVLQGPWSADRAGGNGAAWADYDLDGDVDLVVANALSDTENTTGRNEFLYRNEGNGSFIKITSGPVVTSGGASSAPSWMDYDNDGDSDLFVSNNRNENDFVFRNEGDGRFTRVIRGFLTTDEPILTSSAWADYDNDGDMDLFGKEQETRQIALYRNLGNGTFERVLDSNLPEMASSITSPAWGDFDNDGDLDLLWSNEHGADEELYANNGDGTFSPHPFPGFGGNSYGCAWGDYDNDGFLDVAVSNGGGQSASEPMEEVALLHNESKNLGNTNNWLRVKTVGTISNRSGFGAKVRLKQVPPAPPGEVAFWQMRVISESEVGQNGAHFGLGKELIVQTVRVEWPSGIVQEIHYPETNRMIEMVEPVQLRIASGSEIEVIGRLEPGYRFLASTNLVNWVNVTETMTQVTAGRFLDTKRAESSRRFYQMAVGSPGN